MSNMENFLKLVSSEDTKSLADLKERIKNRPMLRESQQIAIKVLTRLDELEWSQRDLANAMEVSPQQITKIVSGKENLTIETQIKLQNILDIPVLASYYENKAKAEAEKGWVVTIAKRVDTVAPELNEVTFNYQESKSVKSDLHDYSQDHFTEKEHLQMAV